MSVVITSLYAAIAALFYLGLTLWVILYRGKTRISLGDGEDKGLRKRMRVHANFIEYAPLALILIALSELSGATPVGLHILGLALITGRALHAYGFGRAPQILILRQIGMLSTLCVIAAAAVWLLILTQI